MRDHAPPGFGTLAILVAALSIAIVCAPTHWSRFAENELREAIAGVFTRAPSGQVHIVEIDAESIAQVRQWPWPREHHARIVRQLDAAGARSIVFDVDFSSFSSPEGDAAFASAIAEARAQVVLATFSQTASETADHRLDALPIEELREHASLASASVRPDADARIRRMVYGAITNGTPRPSISAQIAGVAGLADTSFAIDFSLDPDSIPRHSFHEVERGAFDRAAIAGKTVLIGASAIELGDRYGVPLYGVIPGVTIQALAAETLIAGAPREIGPVPLLALAALLALLVLRARSYAVIALRASVALVLVVLIALVAYHGARTALEVVPGALALGVAALAQILRVARRHLREQALVDGETGFPNAQAYVARQDAEGGFVVAAFIKDFDSIQAVLGKEKVGPFIARLVDRMNETLALGEVYRADTRIIAWRHTTGFDALIGSLEAISEGLRKPLQLGETRIDAGVSFGIAAAGDLAAASRAASEAAKEGTLWHAHEDAETAIIEQRISLMGELDDAIARGELRVLYQPKLRLSSNRIESVEALVRWEHPERGYLSPDAFIPLAEETDRIESLTLFVLERAIHDLSEWCREEIVLSAAVNISANLVSSERFVSAAERMLCATGVPRDRLIFEVTESATMRDPDLGAHNLERFRQLGVLISMDDYGTGQSSLSYLQKLPLSELKIDRAFVQNAHRNRSDALMVKSTIELAHSLNLRVVCEGVEEEACLAFLRRSGCDYAQGYLISKPLAPDELTALLSQPRGLDAVPA